MARVDELLKEEIGHILQEKISDPRVGFVTVSRVKVAKDLRHAVVSVSFLDESDEAVADALEALERARGFVRRELGTRVQLKYLPDLKFVYDGSAAHASRIQQMLETIQPGEGWDTPPTDATTESEESREDQPQPDGSDRSDRSG